jgi:hypothetical protein
MFKEKSAIVPYMSTYECIELGTTQIAFGNKPERAKSFNAQASEPARTFSKTRAVSGLNPYIKLSFPLVRAGVDAICENSSCKAALPCSVRI